MLSDFTKIELTPKQRGLNPIKTLIYFLVAFFLKSSAGYFTVGQTLKKVFHEY